MAISVKLIKSINNYSNTINPYISMDYEDFDLFNNTYLFIIYFIFNNKNIN